jgi:hypothetical protein
VLLKDKEICLEIEADGATNGANFCDCNVQHATTKYKLKPFCSDALFLACALQESDLSSQEEVGLQLETSLRADKTFG